jgi:hypothetical protein
LMPAPEQGPPSKATLHYLLAHALRGIAGGTNLHTFRACHTRFRNLDGIDFIACSPTSMIK